MWHKLLVSIVFLTSTYFMVVSARNTEFDDAMISLFGVMLSGLAAIALYLLDGESNEH